MNFGFIQSKIDGTEQEFLSFDSSPIPDNISYVDCLPAVINQGEYSICVPCSISAYVNWIINSETGNSEYDNELNYLDIFSHRTNESNDGMSFKDALHYLRHNDAIIKSGNVRIVNRYAKISSIIALKQAIVANGPCIGGLPVYNSNITDFWNKNRGSFEGGHAVAVVGYNKDGFIIRNSWGRNYGQNGYSILPYEDFNKFYELWTIIE